MTDSDDARDEALGFRKLEKVDDHRETSQDHVRRAEKLEKEAESEFVDFLEETLGLPEGGDGTVSRSQLSENTVVEWSPGNDTLETIAERAPDTLARVSVTVEFVDMEAQHERTVSIKELINDIEEDHENGAPVSKVYDRSGVVGMTDEELEHAIEKLKQKGEVYEPEIDHLRTT